MPLQKSSGGLNWCPSIHHPLTEKISISLRPGLGLRSPIVERKYERNRIFHPCRVIFDFYRQAFLILKIVNTFLRESLSSCYYSDFGVWSSQYTLCYAFAVFPAHLLKKFLS